MINYQLINGIWHISDTVQGIPVLYTVPEVSSLNPNNKLTLEMIQTIIPNIDTLLTKCAEKAEKTFIPNTYSPTYNIDISNYPEKYIYIFSHFPNNQNFEVIWKQVAQTIGLKLSNVPTKYNLPLTDQAVVAQISNLSNFMSEDTFYKITDRIEQQKLGIPVLPAIIPTTDSDLDYFGNIPIFVKPRKTYCKILHKYAYTIWESPTALRNAIESDDFWKYQWHPDPLCGEFVITPAIAHPLEDNIVSFSVNENSEVLFLKMQPTIDTGPNDYGAFEAYPEVPLELQAYVRKVCLEQNIKGGIHDLDFVTYEGHLVLMDWNTRPGYGTSAGRFLKSGYMVAALAHMVGLPVPPILPTYTIQRTYRGMNLPWVLCILAKDAGIFARREGIYLYTLAYTGNTKQEALDALNNFEALYNIVR